MQLTNSLTSQQVWDLGRAARVVAMEMAQAHLGEGEKAVPTGNLAAKLRVQMGVPDAAGGARAITAAGEDAKPGPVIRQPAALPAPVVQQQARRPSAQEKIRLAELNEEAARLKAKIAAREQAQTISATRNALVGSIEAATAAPATHEEPVDNCDALVDDVYKMCPSGSDYARTNEELYGPNYEAPSGYEASIEGSAPSDEDVIMQEDVVMQDAHASGEQIISAIRTDAWVRNGNVFDAQVPMSLHGSVVIYDSDSLRTWSAMPSTCSGETSSWGTVRSEYKHERALRANQVVHAYRMQSVSQTQASVNEKIVEVQQAVSVNVASIPSPTKAQLEHLSDIIDWSDTDTAVE